MYLSSALKTLRPGLSPERVPSGSLRENIQLMENPSLDGLSQTALPSCPSSWRPVVSGNWVPTTALPTVPSFLQLLYTRTPAGKLLLGMAASAGLAFTKVWLETPRLNLAKQKSLFSAFWKQWNSKQPTSDIVCTWNRLCSLLDTQIIICLPPFSSKLTVKNNIWDFISGTFTPIFYFIYSLIITKY